MTGAKTTPERFSVRPDAKGYRVYDIRTGETALIGLTPQDGLSREDADATARLLNARDRPKGARK